MELFLTLLSGIGWIIVYEECVRIGLTKKTYCMPLFALGLNFAWESIYAIGDLFFEFHGPLNGLDAAQAYVNLAWACLDVVILYTYVKNGKKEWPKAVSGKWFYPWVLLVLVCSFSLQLIFIKEFGPYLAAMYSAFLQNVLMSVLFIKLFVGRGSDEGQSILLAVAKWIGTLAPTLLMCSNQVVLVCGIFCSVFDLIYIALLLNYKKKTA